MPLETGPSLPKLAKMRWQKIVRGIQHEPPSTEQASIRNDQSQLRPMHYIPSMTTRKIARQKESVFSGNSSLAMLDSLRFRVRKGESNKPQTIT
jgi:hypothetical protein